MIALGMFAMVIYWTYQPLSFEKYSILERDAHKYWAAQKLDKAYDNFMEVIEHTKNDKNHLVSLYGYAGRVAHDNKKYELAIKNFITAIKMNSIDKNIVSYLKNSLSATKSLKGLNSIKELPSHIMRDIFENGIYINYYSDGWSRGDSSSVLIYCEKAQCEHEIEFFTLSTPVKGNKVKIFSENKLIFNDEIKSTGKRLIVVDVKKGLSIITITIDKITLLKGEDQRTVGVNYKVKG